MGSAQRGSHFLAISAAVERGRKTRELKLDSRLSLAMPDIRGMATLSLSLHVISGSSNYPPSCVRIEWDNACENALWTVKP